MLAACCEKRCCHPLRLRRQGPASYNDKHTVQSCQARTSCCLRLPPSQYVTPRVHRGQWTPLGVSKCSVIDVSQRGSSVWICWWTRWWTWWTRWWTWWTRCLHSMSFTPCSEFPGVVVTCFTIILSSQESLPEPLAR